LAETAVSALSDTELEAHIADCGKRLIACMEAWEQGGNFADRGEAMYFERLQAEAIKARSVEQVRRMEVARGLI